MIKLTAKDKKLLSELTPHEKLAAELKWGGIPLDIEFIRSNLNPAKTSELS